MLQVIGAGFGRTGTRSLGLALEILGFGPCYNISELTKNPDHTNIWNHAIDGKPVNWNRLFDSYTSSVEWPAVVFLPEILKSFPKAKVILTLREPEEWFESANATIFDGLELSAHNPDPEKREQGGMKRRLILERTFAGRYREKDYAIKTFYQHNQSVIDIVPPDQLLQFHVKEGWQPLCEFLGQRVPTDPFPKVNHRTEFLASMPDWAKKIKK